MRFEKDFRIEAEAFAYNPFSYDFVWYSSLLGSFFKRLKKKSFCR